MVDTKTEKADAVKTLTAHESRYGQAPWVLRYSIEILADEVERLREFAAYVMAEAWDHNEPDGGSVQDKAESLGLIELHPIDSEDSIDGETEHFFLSWKKP